MEPVEVEAESSASIGGTKPNFPFVHCAIAPISGNGSEKLALSNLNLSSQEPKSRRQFVRCA